jgi:osmotically-inducible protein OsmY
MNNRHFNRGERGRNHENRESQYKDRSRESSPEWRDREEYYGSGESQFGSRGHQVFQGGDFGRGYTGGYSGSEYGGGYDTGLGTYGGHGSSEGVYERPYGHDDRTGHENSFQNRGRGFENSRGNNSSRYSYGQNRGVRGGRDEYIASERGYDMRGNDRHDAYDGERGWWDKTSDEVSSWMGDEEAARRREADHRRHAIHRGRGPKGYTRSDERIKEDINDRLTDYAYLDASDIDVSVSGGEVTLSGTVDTRYAKRMAEDLADDVSGVRNVENRLRVNQKESWVAGYGDINSAGNRTTFNGPSDETDTKSFTKKA